MLLREWHRLIALKVHLCCLNLALSESALLCQLDRPASGSISLHFLRQLLLFWARLLVWDGLRQLLASRVYGHSFCRIWLYALGPGSCTISWQPQKQSRLFGYRQNPGLVGSCEARRIANQVFKKSFRRLVPTKNLQLCHFGQLVSHFIFFKFHQFIVNIK